ncbi:hypothetical protein ACFQZS_12750 [Mucilaginibacter calamicampi]|uniref:Uncharacterized protein n=1 Tax=Mucilaginibacter calamicampi TaxID=1302352 RepID=A0ABW2YZZ4_9SPHI
MKKIYPLLLLLYFGCSKPQPVKIKAELVAKKSILAISGLDSVILNDIARDSIANWQSVFPVYRMPVDTDMKDYQNEQPGNYWVNKGTLFFQPDTAFKPHQPYFLRYYDHSTGKEAWDYIKNNNQKGATAYTDLTFTP